MEKQQSKENKVDSLRSLYHHISESLSTDELSSLKNFVRGQQIQKRKLEQLNTTEDIFIELEETGYISKTKLTLLKDLLGNLNRRPLIDLIKKFESDQLSRKDGGDVQQRGRSTDSPPPERPKSPIAEPKYPDVVSRCKEMLKNHYSNSSEILPFPWWDGANRLKLENVYIQLELLTKQGEQRDFQRREIFSSKGKEKGPRVLVEGDPGYGKSTFCKQLANDWTNGYVEYLNCFKLLFSFELTTLLEYKSEDMKDVIFEHFGLGDGEERERDELWKFIQNNQSKVCFIFDGLDEVPLKDHPAYLTKMVRLNGRLLPCCPVIVTSRKIRDTNSKQMYNLQLLIKGFDSKKARSFVEKHMEAMNSSGELYRKANALDFLKEVEKSSHKSALFDFMKSPLNTLMLCNIWIYEKTLPNTITEIYEEIVNYTVKSYKEKNEFKEQDDKEIEQALLFLGETSYRNLTEPDNDRKRYFFEGILKTKHLSKLGLLTKISEHPLRYGFSHLTFQEYFAATYVADLLTKNRSEFMDVIITVTKEMHRDYDMLLAFIGGKLRDNVGVIFDTWRQKGFNGHDIGFDLRPILYESCCTSVDVFKSSAMFSPENFTVDLDSIINHANANKLSVNLTLLQCSDLRSDYVDFVVSALNTDTLDIFRRSFDALQRGTKSYRAVTFTINGKGYNHSPHQYNKSGKHCDKSNEYLKANCIRMSISSHRKFDTECCQYLASILEILSTLTTNYFFFNEDFQLGDLELIKIVHNGLCSANIFKLATVNFILRPFTTQISQRLKIKANFGPIQTFYDIDCMNTDVKGLTQLISKRASFERKFTTIKCKFEHIRSDSRNKNSHKQISTVAKHLALVSADKLVMEELPLVSLPFVKNVLDRLNSNERLKSISVSFYKCSRTSKENGSLTITAQFGKCTTYIVSKSLKFDLVALHEHLSKLASVDNDKLSLDVTINIEDITKGKDIIDLFVGLESIVFRKINIELPSYISCNEEDTFARISCIFHSLSNVSADKLVIKRCCLENLALIENVCNYLNSNKHLKEVQVTNCDHNYNCKLKVRAQFVDCNTRYDMHIDEFDLAGWSNYLLKLPNGGNERVLLVVEIKHDLYDSSERDDLIRLLERLQSINFRKVIVEMKSYNVRDKTDGNAHVPRILNSLSKLSSERLEVKLHLGKVDFNENVHDCLSRYKRLQPVDIWLGDGEGRNGDRHNMTITAHLSNCRICCRINGTNFDTVGMYRFLSNLPSVDDERALIDVTIDIGDKNTIHDTLNILERLQLIDMRQLKLNMHKYIFDGIKDGYRYLFSILESLSKITADELVITELPFEKIDFIETFHDRITGNKRWKLVDVDFIERSADSLRGKLEIRAQFANCKTSYRVSDANFDLVSLHQCLSRLACLENERLLLDMKIFIYDKDIKDRNFVDALFAKLKSTDMRAGFFEIVHSGFGKDVYASISCVLHSLSWVSADELVMQLPLGNLDFIKNVHERFSGNKQLKSVNVTIFESIFQNKLTIRAQCGNCVTHYFKANMNFDFVSLHKYLSKLASVDNDRVSLDITIHVDPQDIMEGNDVIDLFESLQLIDIRNILITLSDSDRYDMKSVNARFVRILNSLSNISADNLVIEHLHLGTLEFMKTVHSCLNSNKQLKAVDVSFTSHFLERYSLHVEGDMSFPGDDAIISEDSESFSVDNDDTSSDDNDDPSSEDNDGTSSEDNDDKHADDYNKTSMMSLGYADYDDYYDDYYDDDYYDYYYDDDYYDYYDYDYHSAENVRCSEDYYIDSKLEIIAKVGHCRVRYVTNNLNFDLVNLHECLSLLTSLCDDRVLLDVRLQIDTSNILAIKDMCDVLQRLKSVDIRRIVLHLYESEQSDFEQDICLYNYFISDSLSKISASELVIEGLPLGTLDFMKNVHGYLSGNKRLKSIYMTFCYWLYAKSDDQGFFSFGNIIFPDPYEFPSSERKCKLRITTTFGHCRANYLIYDIKFDLAGLHRCLSTLQSVDDDGVLLDVYINIDIKEIINSYDIDDLFRSVELVDVRQISIKVTNSDGIDMEDLRPHIPGIISRFPKVSPDKVVIEGLSQFGLH